MFWLRSCNILVFFIDCFYLLSIVCFAEEDTPYSLGVSMSISDFNVSNIFDNRLLLHQLFSRSTESDRYLSSRYKDGMVYLQTKGDFDITKAYKTMEFHRQMMNDFMISNYVAQKIVYQLKNDEPFLLEKRTGAVNNHSVTNERENEKVSTGVKPAKKSASIVGSIQTHLYDNGSKRYKAWLKRMNTANDIQNYLKKVGGNKFGTMSESESARHNRRQTAIYDSDDEDEENFDEGVFTGYALNKSKNPKNHQNMNLRNRLHLNNEISRLQMNAPNFRPLHKNGHEHGYSDYGGNSPSSHNFAQTQSSKLLKEISLKDITDIALTTLAFLSFGMFILQVLICITVSKEDSSNITMLPMEATVDNEIPNDGIEEIRRKKRSAIFKNRLENMNDLSKRIMGTIDAITSMANDRKTENVLYRSICENNKFARTQRYGQQFWIPFWSLGISWLSGQIGSHSNTYPSYNPILNSLTALTNGFNFKTKCV